MPFWVPTPVNEDRVRPKSNVINLGIVATTLSVIEKSVILGAVKEV